MHHIVESNPNPPVWAKHPGFFHDQRTENVRAVEPQQPLLGRLGAVHRAGRALLRNPRHLTVCVGEGCLPELMELRQALAN